MKQRIALLLLAVILMLSAVPAAAVEIIGTVLSTDIRAYINGAEIPAYNIDGKLAIVVSDLNQYGFVTNYDNSRRKTTVTRNINAASFTSVPSKSEGLPIGTPVMSVYASDIRVELDGRIVPAFNVDNRMAIYFTELKEYGSYTYDNNTRASYLTLSGSAPVRETKYQVPAGFTNGCEFGRFDRFNSHAFENGLAGTPIWINGSFDSVLVIDTVSADIPMKLFYAICTDEYSNKWLLSLDTDYFSELSRYTNIQGHQLCIRGLYSGYSDLYEMPAIEVDTMFDTVTGNITTSILYITAHD